MILQAGDSGTNPLPNSIRPRLSVASRPLGPPAVKAATYVGRRNCVVRGNLSRLRGTTLLLTRGQLLNFTQGAVGERGALGLAADAVAAVARQMGSHFVIDDASRAAEFAQRVEITERREIGIGRIVRAATGERGGSR